MEGAKPLPLLSAWRLFVEKVEEPIGSEDECMGSRPGSVMKDLCQKPKL